MGDDGFRPMETGLSTLTRGSNKFRQDRTIHPDTMRESVPQVLWTPSLEIDLWVNIFGVLDFFPPSVIGHESQYCDIKGVSKERMINSEKNLKLNGRILKRQDLENQCLHFAFLK